eukprot:TRINITY_DN571_c0_g1::TRINITY_DN571_c0_g1_i1::g.10448::m.10448 TRINITY_DN571_c0_g1::TRINITY_DN571_c0_g1_i1::g.10448  ORF type:complete len:953 (+),score=366.68,sp/Q557H3/U505_DICDI/38.11/0.0,Vps35/PF03635.12/0.067,Vps35/PF03635.12/0.00062,ACDC/PF14733.1/2.3e+03,ACDC/PF14733.1/3,ACDC/PF14733.1/1.2e+04,ACDC/PF14733.1/5.9e+03 TRINITY_DN571_c0_g1_i1:21-2879(+)
MVQFDWKPRERDYVREWTSMEAKSEIAASHPLGRGVVAIRKDSVPSDPLSSATAAPTKIRNPLEDNPLDPLSAAAPVTIVTTAGMTVFEEESVENDWETRRETILQRYTTTAQIAFAKNFIDTPVAAPNVPKRVDRVKARLMQLEDEDGGAGLGPGQIGYLTAAEYIARVRDLTEDLKRAWDNEERVKALKLAIQTAKLLSDTSVLSFYPSIFVLVTDLLNTFSQLIYNRLRRKGGNDGSQLGELFDPEEVNEQARETCRNWFYKVASIRELLPRVYIELAILKCYRFVSNSEFPSILTRIASTIRGFGHPLVAAYARCYLAQRGYELTFQKEYLMSAFKDSLFVFQKLGSAAFPESAQRQGLNQQQYWSLYQPALDYLVLCLARHPTKDGFQQLMNVYHKNRSASSAVVLHSILASYPAEFISPYAMSIAAIIKDIEEDSYSKCQIYTALGKCLVKSPPPEDSRMIILNDVWKIVTKVSNIREYMDTALVFVEYLLKYFSDREVNVMLKDILKHIKTESSKADKDEKLMQDSVYPSLFAILRKILHYWTDFERAMALDQFLSLLDVFDKRWKYDACKHVLESFNRNVMGSVNDPVLIYSIYNVAKYLHDSLDYLSFEDERKQVSNLIIAFIRKVDFGRDLEQWLNFLVDCRRVFTHLDPVKSFMVMSVCELSMRTLNIVKGRHTKKTGAFVKGCMAYAHITIPSIDDVFTRLYANVLCGQVALASQCTVQAETFFKEAIVLVQEIPSSLGPDQSVKTMEEPLVSFLRYFASALVVVPGHPQHGACYLVSALITVVNEFPWDESGDGKARVLMAMLQLFSTYTQRSLPYHINRLDSNDTLFAGDSAYHDEVLNLSRGILEEMLNELARLGEVDNVVVKRKQGALALDLFNTLVTVGSLEGTGLKLASNLFGLAKKGSAPAPYLKASHALVQRKAANLPAGYLFAELLTKISL